MSQTTLRSNLLVFWYLRHFTFNYCFLYSVASDRALLHNSSWACVHLLPIRAKRDSWDWCSSGVPVAHAFSTAVSLEVLCQIKYINMLWSQPEARLRMAAAFCAVPSQVWNCPMELLSSFGSFGGSFTPQKPKFASCSLHLPTTSSSSISYSSLKPKGWAHEALPYENTQHALTTATASAVLRGPGQAESSALQDLQWLLLLSGLFLNNRKQSLPQDARNELKSF